jgi:hypothetical protein
LPSDIDTYLRELRSALEGADPALIQDALYDAEEHLHAELTAITERHEDQPGEIAGEFGAVIERYGSPQEVAAAYLGNEEATPTGLQTTVAAVPGFPTAAGLSSSAGLQAGASTAKPGPRRGFFGVVIDPSTYLALLYMLLSLGTGIVFFTIVVTGISVSAGFVILIIGIPFFLGFLAVVRALSLAEGRIVEKLLGTRMPRRSRSEPRGTGLVDRFRFWMKDRRTWTAMLYMILLLPLGTAYFCVSVTGLAVGLGLVAVPFVQVATGHSYVMINDADWYHFPAWSLPLLVIAGVLVIILMLHLIRLIGRAHGGFAKAMLVRLD